MFFVKMSMRNKGVCGYYFLRNFFECFFMHKNVCEIFYFSITINIFNTLENCVFPMFQKFIKNCQNTANFSLQMNDNPLTISSNTVDFNPQYLLLKKIH